MELMAEDEGEGERNAIGVRGVFRREKAGPEWGEDNGDMVRKGGGRMKKAR